jgi:hypothetical protein
LFHLRSISPAAMPQLLEPRQLVNKHVMTLLDCWDLMFLNATRTGRGKLHNVTEAQDIAGVSIQMGWSLLEAAPDQLKHVSNVNRL